jgi:CSLREA domain-containing protein
MRETGKARFRRVRATAVVLAGAFCFAGLGAQAAWAAGFAINSTADRPDAKPGDHVCLTDAATCTLRAAIQEANADGGANTIFIPRGHYRLAIPPTPEAGFAGQDDAGAGDLDITGTLTIRGAGARETIVDGGHLDRVFSTASNATVLFSDMTITGGDSTGGGTSKEIDLGGGIYNQGTATLERLRLIGNNADGGGAVFSPPGSYITISDSLLAHNTAYEAGGVRFDSGGEVVNSTITDNTLLSLPNRSYAQDPKLASALADQLTGYGGGIDHRGGADLTIVNSTITNNHAIKGGGGLNSGQAYAAVSDQTAIARVRLLNAIIAGNTSSAGPGNCNVQDMIIQSDGHNLDGDGSCFLTASGDLPRHNPLLGPLADNGGPTETQALLPGSPAIDAGAADGCPQHDQRAISRPQGAGCDIGAYERVEPAARSTTGARGPAGAVRVEIMTCKSGKTGKGRHRRTVQTCTAKLAGSPVKFTGALAAVLARGKAVYATGSAIRRGRTTTLLLTPRRNIVRGSYTLTLTRGRHRQRETITID